jgi:hypothetical protein
MLTSGFNNMPQSSVASLSWAHPLVQEWFAGRFGSATEPQEQGWPPILAGKSTLICAPTGETATLSAADPLNLVGIIVPGEHVPAISGKTITLRDGATIVEQPCTPEAAAGF